MQYLPFSVWLIPLNIMLSPFIRVVANGRISFFPMADNIPLCVCIFFVHSAIDGQLGFFISW